MLTVRKVLRKCDGPLMTAILVPLAMTFSTSDISTEMQKQKSVIIQISPYIAVGSGFVIYCGTRFAVEIYCDRNPVPANPSAPNPSPASPGRPAITSNQLVVASSQERSDDLTDFVDYIVLLSKSDPERFREVCDFALGPAQLSANSSASSSHASLGRSSGNLANLSLAPPQRELPHQTRFPTHVVITIASEDPDDPLTDVRERFPPDDEAAGSKLFYRRVELGPGVDDAEIDRFRVQIKESMELASKKDKNCTLQVGSFAVLRYTDSGPIWWKIPEHMTPTIYTIQRSSWSLTDLICDRRAKWTVTGINLQSASLRATTRDKSEDMKVLHHYKTVGLKDVMVCEESQLIRNSAPTFPDNVYICASRDVEVELGPTIKLQSEVKNVKLAYRNSVWRGLIPDVNTIISIAILLFLGQHNSLFPTATSIFIVWTMWHCFLRGKSLSLGSDDPSLGIETSGEGATSSSNPTHSPSAEDNSTDQTAGSPRPCTPMHTEDNELEDTSNYSIPSFPEPIEDTLITASVSTADSDSLPLSPSITCCADDWTSSIPNPTDAPRVDENFPQGTGGQSSSLEASMEDTARWSALVKSGKIQEWITEIRKSSSFTVAGPLRWNEWRDFMLFFKYGDLSGMERLELSFSYHDTEKVPRADKIEEYGFGTVLGTDRFSALEMLEIDCAHGRLGLGSASLAGGFRRGHFPNLRALHLRYQGSSPADSDLNPIFEALIEGRVPQLTSFSIYSDLVLYDGAQKFLRSECLRNLRHLAIGGKFFGPLACVHLANRITSGLLPNVTSLDFRGILVHSSVLVDLVEAPGNFFRSLQNLVLRDCGLASGHVCAMVEAIIKLTESKLALKVLCLSYNNLDERGMDALAVLVELGGLPQLQHLDLRSNYIRSGAGLARLMTSIQRGDLPLLKKLALRQNPIGSDHEGIQAVAEAYFENEALTADIDIDWDFVRDGSLEAKVNEYRERNARLIALRNRLEGKESKFLVPLRSSKVFLCGYPEVGKSTLRRTLGRHLGLRTSLRWATLFKEPPTKAIELSRIQDKNNTELILWELASQEEYELLQGTFMADLGLARGKATTFVLIFKVPFTKNVKAELSYWLKFVASTSIRGVKRQVMIVLNCFDGQQCLERHGRYWKDLSTELAAKFSDELHLHPSPIIIDVRIAASVQPLKNELFNQARTLLQDVVVPKACFELLEELKRLSNGENKSRLPIFSWQDFADAWKLEHNTKGDAPKNLKICASYLHEIGKIIYFDGRESTQPVSGKKSIVVPDPEWFCKQVVGRLLLPKAMLGKGSSIQVRADGSISRIEFRALFEHLLPEGTESDDVISLLEQVGLCYRKGLEEISIPALVREDDYATMHWKCQGFHAVIGRCLATEDQKRCTIPGTLFRRLQVELAQDPNFGGCGDSDYRAGRSYSSFTLGSLLVLVQFDVDHSDPRGDRIDVLVKSVLPGDSTDVRLAKIDCVCRIMQKLQRWCVVYSPGLRCDIKVIQPSNATELTPAMTERRLISLTEVKSRLLKGRKYSPWLLDGQRVELKDLLSQSELQAVLASSQPEYDECKREAVTLGLVTEDSLQKLEENFEQEHDSNLQILDVEGSTTKYDSDDGADITYSKIAHEMRQLHLTIQGVHDNSYLTRQYVEKLHQMLMLERQNKHHVLVRHIQAQQEFSRQERGRSVPRYAFLVRSKSKVLKEGFNKRFKLHFLCEFHFDDGLLHTVEGQEGIELTRPKEWVVKITPWLRESLQAATAVVTSMAIPSVAKLYSDLFYLFIDGEGSSKAVDTAVTMMLGEDEGVNQVGGNRRDYGSAGAPVDLQERMIAEGVIKDVIGEIGETAFEKQIGLRKVLFSVSAQPHIGSSKQAQSSEGQSYVRWICQSCYIRYGDRARTIG